MFVMILTRRLMLWKATLRVARHSLKEEKKGCEEMSTIDVRDWFLRWLP